MRRFVEVALRVHELDVAGVDERRAVLFDELADDRRHVVLRVLPKEPVQMQKPLYGDSCMASMIRMSSAFLYTRGRPNSGRGGSSGCIAIRMPTSSHVGMMASRKYFMFSRSFASSTPGNP